MEGICFDTTLSNTGRNKGLVSRVSKELDKYLLQIACRHHVTELRMLHLWKLLTNDKTNRPDNPLFKKLKNIFKEPLTIIHFYCYSLIGIRLKAVF